MNPYTILLALAIVMIASCTQAPEPIPSERYQALRMMSYNIRFDNPQDGPNAWPHRKDMVANMFRFHNMDVVGTQEGLINQIEHLDEVLPDFDWVGLGRDDGARAGEFCAIFFRTDRFEKGRDGTFWLSETPDVPGSMGWDTAITRIVTWVELFDRVQQQTFFLFNTHYDHRGREARRNSSKLLLEKAVEIAGNNPVVIMGDLNALDNDDPYLVLADPDRGPVRLELFDGYYHNRYGHYGPSATWNGFREISDRRIDYIFATAHFEFVHHGILADQRNGLFPSDHLPVVGELLLR